MFNRIPPSHANKPANPVRLNPPVNGADTMAKLATTAPVKETDPVIIFMHPAI